MYNCIHRAFFAFFFFTIYIFIIFCEPPDSKDNGQIIRNAERFIYKCNERHVCSIYMLDVLVSNYIRVLNVMHNKKKPLKSFES